MNVEVENYAPDQDSIVVRVKEEGPPPIGGIGVPKVEVLVERNAEGQVHVHVSNPDDRSVVFADYILGERFEEDDDT